MRRSQILLIELSSHIDLIVPDKHNYSVHFMFGVDVKRNKLNTCKVSVNDLFQLYNEYIANLNKFMSFSVADIMEIEHNPIVSRNLSILYINKELNRITFHLLSILYKDVVSQITKDPKPLFFYGFHELPNGDTPIKRLNKMLKHIKKPTPMGSSIWNSDDLYHLSNLLNYSLLIAKIFKTWNINGIPVDIFDERKLFTRNTIDKIATFTSEIVESMLYGIWVYEIAYVHHNIVHEGQWWSSNVKFHMDYPGNHVKFWGSHYDSITSLVTNEFPNLESDITKLLVYREDMVTC